MRAALGGDLAELMEILAPDVTVWTDGGGMQKRNGSALPPSWKPTWPWAVSTGEVNV